LQEQKAALQAALTAYEQKGIRPAAARVRAQLADLSR
jgi:hypothetical protein